MIMQKSSDTHSDTAVAITVDSVGVAYMRRSGFLTHKKYWALKDLSFNLYVGETLGVIGKNGVGKSTLLRLLGGIIAPDIGKLTNHNVKASLLSLQAGFVQYLTGRENVILSGMLLGMSKENVLNCMESIYDYADIGDFFDQPVSGYSAGMKTRLGFSIAINIEPDVILLDEVLGVGDAEFREKSSHTIKQAIKSDKTFVLVSHNHQVVEALCDRVILIDKGSVIAEGKPENVISIYKSMFTGKDDKKLKVGSNV